MDKVESSGGMVEKIEVFAGTVGRKVGFVDMACSNSDFLAFVLLLLDRKLWDVQRRHAE
jgi:hypothetical protein